MSSRFSRVLDKIFFSTKLVTTGRFTEIIRMIDLYMAEIFNFSTIEEKNEFYKFELQKIS